MTPQPSEPSKSEKWIPVSMLFVAIAVALILYFRGGDPARNLAILTGYVALILIFAYGLLTLYAMASGKIDLSFLVSEENGHASMSRFQLLIFTFVIAISIILMVVSSPTPKFPAIPNEVLILLGLSASTYAVSKGIQKSAESDKAEINANVPPPPPPPDDNNKAMGKAAGQP